MVSYHLFIIYFVIFFVVLIGGTIMFLRWILFSDTDSSIKRLERETESARAREAELNRKIKQADEELTARKKEMDQIEQRMKGQLEEEANKHKEELINKARSEAEEIIIKAQTAADGIRKDIEKQMELKIIDYSTKILNEMFSKKAKVAFEKDLIEEFIAQLKDIDMSKISLEITKADVVTTCGISDGDLRRIADIVKAKTGREIALEPKISEEFVAGVVIKFGSLHLDGSIRNAVRESAIALKGEVEKGNSKK
jgi:F0F1-type ATP synthase membrane subunit b/b'